MAKQRAGLAAEWVSVKRIANKAMNRRRQLTPDRAMVKRMAIYKIRAKLRRWTSLRRTATTGGQLTMNAFVTRNWRARVGESKEGEASETIGDDTATDSDGGWPADVRKECDRANARELRNRNEREPRQRQGSKDNCDE